MPYINIPVQELIQLSDQSPLPQNLKEAQIFSYDTKVFPFREHVASVLGIQENFQTLHQTEEGKITLAYGLKKRRKDRFVKTWRSSQGTAARIAFNETLHHFVDTFISTRMADRELTSIANVAYQKEPILRVIPPSDEPPTALHCDADYHHPPAEVNWWLPLCTVADTNSLFIESSPGKGDFQPVSLEYGQVLRFYGNLCQHYTVANTSNFTRVSLDLRVLALEYHNDDWRDRMGRSSIYKVGKYYIPAGGNSCSIAMHKKQILKTMT